MTTKTISEIKTYQLATATGRSIRKATMVRFADGYEVKFTERMSKRAATEQAIQFRARNA